MHPSTVTYKGQVTIPASLRKALNITEGDRVDFKKVGHQILITPLKKVELMDLFGFLPVPSKPLTLEEINTLIETQG